MGGSRLIPNFAGNIELRDCWDAGRSKGAVAKDASRCLFRNSLSLPRLPNNALWTRYPKRTVAVAPFPNNGWRSSRLKRLVPILPYPTQAKGTTKLKILKEVDFQPNTL